MQSQKPASSKHLKPTAALTCCRSFFFSFTLCILRFCFRLGLALGALMTTGTNFQEDQCQQREDKRLHKRHEELQRDEDGIGEERQNESKDGQYCTAGKDVAEKTERE